MPTITCKLPEALDAELEAVAEKRGVSKSEVVREAIEASLPEQSRRAGLSAFDVMQSASGILKDGPHDLATHPRHLEGFGRD
jgi:Arc/MetJ-type ribon-helix-helix transcriptional regulator